MPDVRSSAGRTLMQHEKTDIACPQCEQDFIRRHLSFEKQTRQIVISLHCRCGFHMNLVSQRYSLNQRKDAMALFDAAEAVLKDRSMILIGKDEAEAARAAEAAKTQDG